MQTDPAYRLVRLINGAYSVHSLAHGETFHPVIGPVAEAEALYVRQVRLPERLQNHEGEFVLWDVGLGAAANALTVLQATRHLESRIRVVSFDHSIEPLRFALAHAEELGYFATLQPFVKELVTAPERPLTFEHHRQKVRWEVHLGDFPSLIRAPAAHALVKPHLILFDAFSPATNPEMWTQSVFSTLFGLLDPNRPCALPTYSRSTMLRVTLLLAGFFVGKGHATGEKEETTLAANSLKLLEEPLDASWLKRVRNSTSAQPLSEPVYRQAPLASDAWLRLLQHPQFAIGL